MDKDVVLIYSGLLLGHKRMKQCHLQQHGCIILSEVIQRKKISYDSTYTWNLIFKTTQMNLLTNRNRLRDRKQTYGSQRVKVGRDKFGV